MKQFDLFRYNAMLRATNTGPSRRVAADRLLMEQGYLVGEDVTDDAHRERVAAPPWEVTPCHQKT